MAFLKIGLGLLLVRLLIYFMGNRGLFIAEIGNLATEYAYITKTSYYVNIMTLIFDVQFVKAVFTSKMFCSLHTC